MCQRKEATEGMQSIIQWEEGCQDHQLTQIDNLAVKEILGNYDYRFIPNPKISNARHVLGNTPTGVYLSHFTNKKFHDLTTKKSIPAVVVTVLDFGLKFIPVPKKSINQDDADEAIKRFDRDFYLKVFFTNDYKDSDDEEPIEKLQLNSVWKPDQPPHKISQCIGEFEGAIERNFRPQCGKSNLTKFQANILQQIRSNQDINIAHADKNLGPVGIDTEQYIRWVLDEHLSDATPMSKYLKPTRSKLQTTSSQRSTNGCKKLEHASPRMLEVTSAIGFRKTDWTQLDTSI